MGDTATMTISDVNVALVRLALSEDKSEAVQLRESRVAEGLSPELTRQELHVAVNTVSREDELEGDEYLSLLTAVEAQEKSVAENPPNKEKLFESAVVVFKEALAINEDGTINVCIITPGWGNSGFYSEDLLKNSADVFKEGLHMYWDHPTVSEEYQRPERSLRDLAGVLAETAEWRDQGFGGPGLYASAKVFSPYMESLDEMAPYIGVSVVIYGTSHLGEVDGTSGEIIDSIVAARSADFVTLPARGGKVEAKFESLKEARRIKQLIEGGKGGELVDQAEAKRLKDENEQLKTELESERKESRANREAALKSTSDRLVSEAVDAVENLPDETKSRIKARLSDKSFVKDDKIDEDVIKTAVEAEVKSEAEYLSKLGLEKITDLGPTKKQESDDDTEIDEKQYQDEMAATFESLGLSKESARRAAVGRA